MFKRIIASMVLASALISSPAWSETAFRISPEDVERIEDRLSALGYLSSAPDQSFDQATQKAVEVFQFANGLPVTGQLDYDTEEALMNESALSRQDYLQRFAQNTQSSQPLKMGDINNQVQVLQRRLQENGYFTDQADGVFGDATRQAVEKFQRVNGLPVTGTADGLTQLRLMADVPITWQGYLSEMSCAAGDMGLNVYTLQRKMLDMGYFEGDCTGSYGDLTRQAVKAFQQSNGLEPTGVADAAVWDLIYSPRAVSRRNSELLQWGDAGERVLQIQQALRTLGYLSDAAEGEYDYATETAVRLFQMANALSVTGRAGADTMNALMSDEALAMTDDAVVERFAAMLSSDAVSRETISEIAQQMVGKAFNAAEDALYPGFPFVQYVLVAAGLPITAPEALTRLTDQPLTQPRDALPGEVLAFQTSAADSIAMLMGVSVGEGRVIYTTRETGWVVMGYIDQIDSQSVYRWGE